MGIAELCTLLNPPGTPLEQPGPEAWAKAEAVFGPLPDDYREFVNLFGTGSIDQFLWILNPASRNSSANLIGYGREILSAAESLRRDWPERHPYTFFPAPGGLLPFGGTDNGDILFWRTVGRGDQWTVVANAARDQEYQEFPFGMVDFLINVLSRRAVVRFFPITFPTRPTVFTPMTS